MYLVPAPTFFGAAACSLGLSATSQQYFSFRTNQPPATSQQYFSLRTNQHQSSATSQTNRLQIRGGANGVGFSDLELCGAVPNTHLIQLVRTRSARLAGSEAKSLSGIGEI
jgi:hypothetical protein